LAKATTMDPLCWGGWYHTLVVFADLFKRKPDPKYEQEMERHVQSWGGRD